MHELKDMFTGFELIQVEFGGRVWIEVCQIERWIYSDWVHGCTRIKKWFRV